ncbi:MAG: D-alanine aminotransferase [Paracoccaceae bacterium]|nr:MAG: D-alanine aminotransferase [Paracoccaceae bacterium]
MGRIVHVNGDFLPEEEARIPIFDRGFLFADAVYEVTSVLRGRLVDWPGHVARLKRSLAELAIPMPRSEAELLAIHRELIDRNRLGEGVVYMQVTRGVADRDFAWEAGMTPGLVLFTQARPLIDNPAATRGLRVALMPDLRWARRDIKTVQLLYPAIAKMRARERGCDDAWLVEDGLVTEGTSNNAWIITRGGEIVTRDLSSAILHGVTRAAILNIAAALDLKATERPFTPEEARDAAEAFTTSASGFVMPVIEIEGTPVGDGRPGPVTQRLRAEYIQRALDSLT